MIIITDILSFPHEQPDIVIGNYNPENIAGFTTNNTIEFFSPFIDERDIETIMIHETTHWAEYMFIPKEKWCRYMFLSNLYYNYSVAENTAYYLSGTLKHSLPLTMTLKNFVYMDGIKWKSLTFKRKVRSKCLNRIKHIIGIGRKHNV